MRNVMKATTLESRFPLLTVEHGCIVSKDADVTVAYRVDLPELFTVSSAEYEMIHAAWAKAIKVLPDYSVVFKQDWFVKENYRPDMQRDNMSFLSRSFERHFAERPFLNHRCFLFLTKTTKERMRQQSMFNSLGRGFIVPKEIQDKDAVLHFIESADQFQRIVNECGFVKLTRLSDEEITGTQKNAGLIEQYFALSMTDAACLEDIYMGADQMRIGDHHLCLHTLSNPTTCPRRCARTAATNG